jgi:hypothetical protein
MKALEIYVNGKQVSLAAPKDHDGLYAQIEIWDHPESDREDSLAVWGRDGNRVATWAYCQLGYGDEITIRVVDAHELSSPVGYAPVLPEYER